MDIHCNVSVLEAQAQINSTVFHLVKMATMCVSCTLNTVLSFPLLLAITRPPCLLSHARFLFLAHLLLCYNLQVDLLLSTAVALDRFVAVKWPLRYDLLVCRHRMRATVAAIWTIPAVLAGVALGISLNTIHVNFFIPRCRPLVLTPCLSNTSSLLLYCTAVTAVVMPLCSLTILGCFCVLCWDMGVGLLCTHRACVTLTLQGAQTVLFSVPAVMDSYLIPGYLHSDALDIATTIIYNLGVSLIPLVYGYRSRELQQRLLQAANRNKVTDQN